MEVSCRLTGQFSLTPMVSCLVHLRHFLPEGSGNACKLSPQGMRPEMPGVIALGNQEEQKLMEKHPPSSMLRCVLWIQSQRLHVETLAGRSPVVHGMAPFTNSCYWLSLPPLSSAASACVHWVWLPHELLVLGLNVCLLDKRIETLRRHWDWITRQSDGKRHPVTGDESGGAALGSCQDC